MQAHDTPNNEATPEALSVQPDATPTEAPQTDATATTESTPSLEEMIRKAELQAAEHHDAWLRAKAETENVRRRAAEDIAKASKFAVEKFSKELLAVKDSLEAGLATENPSVESLKSGTELTLKQLVAAFEKASIKEINPTGEKFDPHFHQAISMIEADQDPNTVVTVLQKGYLLAERVLRPALVVVAKAKA
ncbi:nucleotide exchange factor GrpE [uncultured Propionivibrio sp.]|uniref:nucleotide exchange factor GrpE n=1 Tax=uncultured Propionivibrio sp. TaxID=426737 RepID=UPI0029C070E5|nr:nucleotide exchange factor GrpE [uncultured Propionivibrio sp.]